MTGDLLLEIGTEEIPARFIAPALKALGAEATRQFREAAVAFGEVRTCGTPRRLALLVTGVADEQADRRRDVTGPPQAVAFDKNGKPTKAAEGFARSQGVSLDRLEIRQTDRGAYVAAVIEEKGAPVSEVLPAILTAIVSGLAFPKSMRWGSGTFRFARPVHWIGALHNGSPVSFSVGGVSSGAVSRGHRFLSPASFELRSTTTYREDLRSRSVIVDPEERREIIRAEATRLAGELGGRVVDDGELLDTVTDLVEYPVPLLGRFDRAYLELPRELLVTVMRGHQKYFAVEDDRHRLLPGFVVVSNTTDDNAETVVRGNERVLKARLEDARFYYEDDRKAPLASRVEALKNITFQEKLGSVHDKIERVARIADGVARRIAPKHREEVARAVRLAKADLSTGVVYEFPELQGYMGMVYAREDGEAGDVPQAIEDHYRPRFSGDAVPATTTGAVVALADKIDSVAAFFSIGLRPTGSEDPYALRRQALGILAILEQGGFDLDVEGLIDLAVAALPDGGGRETGLHAEVATFFRQRLQHLLVGEGHPHDVVDAVLAGRIGRLSDLRDRLAGLNRLRDGTGWTDLVTAAKRVNNILAKAGRTPVREALFEDPAEKGLLDASRAVEASLLVSRPDGLHDLVGPVNAFFDAVLVMDTRPEVRDNRLGLLRCVHEQFSRVADFSQLVD